jgi:hypothetical protein
MAIVAGSKALVSNSTRHVGLMGHCVTDWWESPAHVRCLEYDVALE